MRFATNIKTSYHNSLFFINYFKPFIKFVIFALLVISINCSSARFAPKVENIVPKNELRIHEKLNYSLSIGKITGGTKSDHWSGTSGLEADTFKIALGKFLKQCDILKSDLDVSEKDRNYKVSAEILSQGSLTKNKPQYSSFEQRQGITISYAYLKVKYVLESNNNKIEEVVESISQGKAFDASKRSRLALEGATRYNLEGFIEGLALYNKYLKSKDATFIDNYSKDSSSGFEPPDKKIQIISDSSFPVFAMNAEK